MARLNVRLMIAALAFAISAAAGVAHAATDAKLVAEAQSTLATYQKTDPGVTTSSNAQPGMWCSCPWSRPGSGSAALTDRAWCSRTANRSAGPPFRRCRWGHSWAVRTYSEVIFFETPQALASFTNGQFSFSAQASAVALKSGAAANAKFKTTSRCSPPQKVA